MVLLMTKTSATQHMRHFRQHQTLLSSRRTMKATACCQFIITEASLFAVAMELQSRRYSCHPMARCVLRKAIQDTRSRKWSRRNTSLYLYTLMNIALPSTTIRLRSIRNQSNRQLIRPNQLFLEPSLSRRRKTSTLRFIAFPAMGTLFTPLMDTSSASGLLNQKLIQGVLLS